MRTATMGRSTRGWSLRSLSAAFLLLGALPWTPGCVDSPPLPVIPDSRAALPDGAVGDLVAPQGDITVGPPVALTVATFNVHNFFDEIEDPTTEDEVPAAAEVATKIGLLGAALRALAADVLALQEVENKALLDRLNGEELASLGYAQVRLFPGNDIRGINVALLSRFPVPRAVSHVKETFPGVDGDTKTYGFSRDCLEVIVEPSPGRRLFLLVNHLRANDGNMAEAVARRQAQAAHVRQIAEGILASYPGANLAVLGDLNDTPGSRTLQLLQEGTPPLEDLLLLAPAAERYTFAGKTQLDYILASPGLRADLDEGSVRAHHDAVFKSASDHSPVSARFTLE